jgi:membrane protein
VADKPAGELASDLAKQASELVREELRLALTEMRDKVAKAGFGSALLLVAGILALYAGAVALAGMVLVLARIMPAWFAAAVIGALLVVTATVAGAIGLDRIQRAVPLIPEEAVAGIAEDVKTVQDHLD